MGSNLEKSEVVIAKILKLLMDQGLKDSMMSFRSLNLEEEYEPFFKTCFLWLIAEGLVRSSTNSESITSIFHAYGPVLTAKGFSVLGVGVAPHPGPPHVGEGEDRVCGSIGEPWALFRIKN